ncbi:MAG: hypothetical protein L0Y76_02620 [Ignavibacteria bacterium]|nr:hypothetical protein [Ignavibacteria bacterium]
MNTFLRYAAVFLYAVFLFAFLISLFGGSRTNSFLGSTAEKTLEKTGFTKNRIDTLDNKIDESIYTLDTYAYQISKFRNFFSGEEPTSPKKIKHEYIAGSLYYPVLSAVIFTLRIILFSASLVFLLTAIIFNLLYKLSSVSTRLKIIETKIKRFETTAVPE